MHSPTFNPLICFIVLVLIALQFSLVTIVNCQYYAPSPAGYYPTSYGGSNGVYVSPSNAVTSTVGGTLDKYNSDTLAYKDKIQVLMFVPFVAQSSGYTNPSYGGGYGGYGAGYPYGGSYGASPYSYYQPGSNYQSIQTPGGRAYSS